MLHFTPLLGAQSDSPASQSLLELDGGVKILVDVGWDDSFDPTKLRELERHVSTLSIILLTHATPGHLAAFAYCCKHLPLFTRIPVYATTPVISLGRTLTLDLYASAPLATGVIPPSALSDISSPHTSTPMNGERSHILLPPPTSEEIAGYFSLIHPLKYSQSHQPLGSPFSPPLNGLTITAYCSGHTLGGAIWHIQHGLESIVYAVDWHQARENVIPGAAWLGGAGGGEVTEQLRKPTAMICSARGAVRTALPGGRKRRDESLLAMIRDAVARGGNVLIPTDSSARVIEMAYLLEHAWRAESAKADNENPLKNAKLYLAAKSAGSTMRYARSMLEWMEEGIVREFESEVTADASHASRQGGNRQRGGRSGDDRKAEPAPRKAAGPFDFQHLQLLEHKGEVQRALRRVAKAQDRGKSSSAVILASDTSLEWGLSRDIFRQISSDTRNLIILTEPHGQEDRGEDRGAAGLGQKLWGWWWRDRKDDGTEVVNAARVFEPVPGDGREVDISESQRMPLEGSELLVYQQYLATKQQLHNMIPQEGNAAAAASLDNVDDATSDESTSSDESDSERQGKALNTSAALASSSRSKMQLTDRELGVNVLLRRKGVYDFYVRGKKGRERMFPFVARRRRADAFGDAIRPDEFLKAEERDEANAQEAGTSGAGQDQARPVLGQKRKWEDTATSVLEGRRRGSTVTAKGSQGARDRSAGKGRGDGDEQRASNGAEVSDDDDGSGQSEDESESTITGPSKIVIRTEHVAVKLGIAYVDFAGLHDKRSLQMLIPLIEPRKLILVEGSREETLSLADDCRRLLKAKSGDASDEVEDGVFAPTTGLTVDASVDTNAWTLRLGEALVKRLHWQHVRSLGVVHINGRLSAADVGEAEAEAEHGASKKQKIDANEAATLGRGRKLPGHDLAVESPPLLDLLPPTLAASHRSLSQPLHVGDLRLADLKKSLQGSGHVAEFRGEGTLLVDGLVSVRKLGTGRIEVEGVSLAMSHMTAEGAVAEGIFNDVKRRIYEGLAVVAGA